MTCLTTNTNIEEYTQLESIYDYIMSLSGRIATPDLLDELLCRRQEFIIYLRQNGLYYLLTPDIKDSFMWQIVDKIQNILKLFDERIYELRRMDFNMVALDYLQQDTLKRKLENAKLY